MQLSTLMMMHACIHAMHRSLSKLAIDRMQQPAEQQQQQRAAESAVGRLVTHHHAITIIQYIGTVFIPIEVSPSYPIQHSSRSQQQSRPTFCYLYTHFLQLSSVAAAAVAGAS